MKKWFGHPSWSAVGILWWLGLIFTVAFLPTAGRFDPIFYVVGGMCIAGHWRRVSEHFVPKLERWANTTTKELTDG